jgi:hypothetical protein
VSVPDEDYSNLLTLNVPDEEKIGKTNNLKVFVKTNNLKVFGKTNNLNVFGKTNNLKIFEEQENHRAQIRWSNSAKVTYA